MKLEAAKFLVEVAEFAGIEASVYHDYSGRGMFGEKTVGVTVENPIALLGAAIEYAAEYTDDEPNPIRFADWDLHKLRSDSMGRRDVILY